METENIKNKCIGMVAPNFTKKCSKQKGSIKSTNRTLNYLGLYLVNYKRLYFENTKADLILLPHYFEQ
jgi:putative methionine-R-sulfoxide reductase with GAF domain